MKNILINLLEECKKLSIFPLEIQLGEKDFTLLEKELFNISDKSETMKLGDIKIIKINLKEYFLINRELKYELLKRYY